MCLQGGLPGLRADPFFFWLCYLNNCLTLKWALKSCPFLYFFLKFIIYF